MLTGDRHTPVLFGFSPAVLPKPADWGSQLHVTGYWFLEYPAGWTPPDNLAGFLDVGSPPVSIGFGSMGLTDPVGREDFLKMALEALSLSGQRGILLTSDKKHRGGVKLSDRALLLDSCPYSWLFPRMAVVVHHGGVGTAAAGLRTGVPTVTIPVYTDQPFWGWRVAEIGVGPAPIPRHKLTVQRLAKAIIGAASDLGVRAMAAALGKRIRNEDGVGRAVELLHSHFPSIDSHTREMGVDRKSDAHTGV
jgi:UDP:flavonoid glycosyltransferase YjiC (YdhE family)